MASESSASVLAPWAASPRHRRGHGAKRMRLAAAGEAGAGLPGRASQPAAAGLAPNKAESSSVSKTESQKRRQRRQRARLAACLRDAYEAAAAAAAAIATFLAVLAPYIQQQQQQQQQFWGPPAGWEGCALAGAARARALHRRRRCASSPGAAAAGPTLLDVPPAPHNTTSYIAARVARHEAADAEAFAEAAASYGADIYHPQVTGDPGPVFGQQQNQQQQQAGGQQQSQREGEGPRALDERPWLWGFAGGPVLAGVRPDGGLFGLGLDDGTDDEDRNEPGWDDPELDEVAAAWAAARGGAAPEPAAPAAPATPAQEPPAPMLQLFGGAAAPAVLA